MKLALDVYSVPNQSSLKSWITEIVKVLGRIDDLKLKINLHDYEPVKRSYTSLPKPLYKEVKEYIEDLLAQGWVQKSNSSYSSPLVCVRKKDGTERVDKNYL